MANLLFKRSVVRVGSSAYVDHGDGIWKCVGDLRGVELREFARRLRYPVLHMWIDMRTLPDAIMRELLPFQFDDGPKERSENVCGRY